MKIIKINAMWCPACLIMKKVWNNIYSEYKDINVIEYDYDMDNDIVSKYNPGTVLPVVIIQDDQDNEFERIIGEIKEDKLKDILNKYI